MGFSLIPEGCRRNVILQRVNKLHLVDDSINTSQMLVPTTTIDFSATEAVQQSLQLCRRRLTNPGAKPIHARIAPSLIVRESSISSVGIEVDSAVIDHKAD